MRNESIVFRGINRNTSDIGTESGYCEELISVRSDGGQMKIMAPKKALKTTSYNDVIEHVTSSSRNFIGHYVSGGYHIFEKFEPSTSASPIVISNNDIPHLHEIYYTCLNNFLVISDKTDIKTYIYVCDGKGSSGYSKFFDGIENIGIVQNFTHTYPSSSESAIENTWTVREFYQSSDEFPKEDFSKGKFIQDAARDSLKAAMNKATDERPSYSEGYVVTAVTVTLWDNSEIQIGNFVTHTLDLLDSYSAWTDPVESRTYDDRTFNLLRVRYSYDEGQTQQDYIDGFVSYIDVKNFGGIDVHFNSVDLSQYRDIIKSVNLYCSYPVSRLDFDKALTIDNPESTTEDHYFLHFQETALKDGIIDKQLMYLQKSWGMDELPTSSNKYSIQFGKRQVVENTLDVTSRVMRAGNIFTYNKRLHFFNTNAKAVFDNAMISDQFDTGATLTCSAYVFLRVDGVVKVVKHSSVAITSKFTQPNVINTRKMFIYPDSRAYRIVLVNSSNMVIDTSLKSSKTYNYSYFYEGSRTFATNESVISELSQYSSCTTTVTYGESTAINVTSQGNPIYFPVQNSYKVDSRIAALSVAFEAVSSVQQGQYPVYIFTDSGIFAMEQGSGDVLYSCIVPVSSDSVTVRDDGPTPNVRQTRYGIVYVSNGKLMIINGRTTKCLSEMLDGEPDMDIRGISGSSFYQCCCNNNTYNIGSYLSNVWQDGTRYFPQFLKFCRINYSASQDEIIISADYNYSYVFNLEKNTWYKIQYKFLLSTVNDMMIHSPGVGSRSLIDYSVPTSTATEFHIQTRPILLSPNQYTTILRSVLNVKANIASDELVSAYIFASDNTFDWKCVAGAQKRNCEIKDIRLNRSDSAYRYHVIIIGGKAKPDTEILNMVMTIEDKLNNKLR